MTLTDRDREMLDLAGRPYAFEGVREQHIREKWDMSATRFWHLVNALLDDPEALAYAPATVHRLRRLRERRRWERSAQRLGIEFGIQA